MHDKVETYDTLWSLVDLDPNEHLIKELSKLFLEAMQDWPTRNPQSIPRFISELRNCFGESLTLELIKTKAQNGLNGGLGAWQLESSGSLIEMLELYSKYHGSIQLDELLDKLILHYNREFGVVDFIAELSYLTTEDGGRKTPAKSGYRPHVKFEFDEMYTSGQQTFIDKELVNPGESVKAKIKILAADHFSNSLIEGMNFEFWEGARLIGKGKINYIVNSKLEKECR